MNKPITIKVIMLFVVVVLQHPSTSTQRPFLAKPVGKRDAFLDSLKRSTFLYFRELAGQDNGLIPDRGPNPKAFCSIAATGFGLTALLVGIKNGYITRQEAALQVLKTLRFFNGSKQDSLDRKSATGFKGFYYHFLDMKTGTRFKDVELSTIDTGLLMMGILSCETYFDGKDPLEHAIRALALKLYSRVNWRWAVRRGNLISMGWKPEHGFLSSDYKGYDEASFLYVLGLGSPSYSLPKASWTAFTSTNRWGRFQNQEMINFGPLFGHQYTQCWLDLRSLKDDYIRAKGIDYFENSRRATYANRAYCINNPLKRKGFSALIWGLTACDGPGDETHTENSRQIKYMGYSARGAALGYLVDDGTIAPTAAGGSVAFAPEICLPSLKAIKAKYESRVYGRYGFVDAFNPGFTFHRTNGWFDPEYLGIDEGPIVLMSENYQTRFIWNLMRKNSHVRLGLKRAGFTGGYLDSK